MADISFNVPTDIRFGLDVVNRIATLVGQYGERVLLVTEAILYEGKVIERIQTLLEKKGIQYIIYDEVVPHATSSVVDEGLKLARSSHADVVVGLGGVKTLSIAKCMAMAAPQGGEMDDYLSGVQAKGQPLPYVAVPTTCRDPFLFLDEYLMIDSRDRTAKVGRAQRGITRAAIVDPKLTITLPAKYTATTLLDTLLMAVEGYISARSNFLSDTLFARACELIGRVSGQVATQPEDLRVRMSASMAGLLSALGLTMSKTGVGTAVAYAINGSFMVPKSWVAAILLPHVMEFFSTVAAEKLAKVAALLGEDLTDMPPVEGAARAVEAVRRLLGVLGLPARLRDFDLNLDDMVDVAGTARSFDMMNYLPRAISTEDLYELIKAAF
ncbi:MAG: iron-containing alcohol dehydrogenase [Spirochaetales bacterium]|nr:iron-containing alcohol dehydrogenase [Spirochaetales bacterium]